MKLETFTLQHKIKLNTINKFMFCVILFLMISTASSSQHYPAEILNYDIVCKVEDKQKINVKKRILIKINSAAGREHAEMQIHYSNRSSIKEIKVHLLNDQRELIKSLKKKDIHDFTSFTGYFHTDHRHKEIKAHHNEYPYLIELSYEMEYNEFFWLPTWDPQYRKNIPVKRSSYSLTVPYDYTFHHKIYNFKPQETVQKDVLSKTYLWQVENLSPILILEPFSKSLESIYPTALFVPDDFVFGGIAGATNSWKEVGNWVSKLNVGLDILPQREVEKVRELTKGVDTEYEKVKILYAYLQKETRYINVSIGIGGWKPHSASYVVENKYGDCKALTIYMKAMLKAIGIESYYSLIMAGKNEPDIDTSLPGMNFNHVVLYVPLKNDKIWLECTSQTNAFNYWSTFTNGKHALVCDFENSFISQTPQFTNTENSINQISDVRIDKGQLVVDMQREVSGEAYERAHLSLMRSSNQDPEKIDRNIFPFTNCRVSNIEYAATEKNNSYSIIEKSSLIFENHTQEFGSNIIVNPFSSYLKLEKSLGDHRATPISIRYNYKITDVVQYHIPEGYEFEPLTGDQIFSKYGECNINIVEENNKVKVSKEYVLHKGIYPQTDYAAFKSFIDKMIGAENQKILFKKL